MDVRPGEPERLGVTRLQRDLNFAAAVPENRDCSLLLYKKGSAKIEQEIPFTEEMRRCLCSSHQSVSSRYIRI